MPHHGVRPGARHPNGGVLVATPRLLTRTCFVTTCSVNALKYSTDQNARFEPNKVVGGTGLEPVTPTVSWEFWQVPGFEEGALLSTSLNLARPPDAPIGLANRVSNVVLGGCGKAIQRG